MWQNMAVMLVSTNRVTSYWWQNNIIIKEIFIRNIWIFEFINVISTATFLMLMLSIENSKSHWSTSTSLYERERDGFYFIHLKRKRNQSFGDKTWSTVHCSLFTTVVSYLLIVIDTNTFNKIIFKINWKYYWAFFLIEYSYSRCIIIFVK